jgi:radical SAM/SPASM domain protein of ACGX system
MEYFAFQWHITDHCDQRCLHCYIYAEGHPRPVEMPLDEAAHVVEECLEMCRRMGRLPYFYVTGGDPILHSHFWEIAALLHDHKIPFTILGNPFHLTDEVCARLHSLGCEKYQLSLDGLRETHDAIRKAGSFDTTLEKIGVLRRAGIRCAVMTTVSGTNLHEIPELIDVVVAHHVDVFAFGRYCPTGPDKSTHIEPLEYRAFLERVWQKFEQYKESDTTFNLKDHLWTLFLYERGLFHIPEGLDADTIYDGCNCGNCHLTILPTGEVMACRRFESPLGNVRTTSLYDLFHGERMESFRQYEKFEKCRYCELLRFCRGCPAVTYGYTHNFYAPDPQCWKEITPP